jgi:hypothetical protein
MHNHIRLADFFPQACQCLGIGDVTAHKAITSMTGHRYNTMPASLKETAQGLADKANSKDNNQHEFQ